MEYEQFYKFLEGRPVKELSDCIHHIVDMVATRITTLQPKFESIQKASIEAMTRVRSGNDEGFESETVRSASVLKNVICNGIQLPHGMNGFNTKTKRFIRWLTGYDKPVSVKVGAENNLQPDWFLHKDLQVWLNWNPEGYFEMSRKDSLKFNESNPTNRHLLDSDHPKHGEKRKPDSDAPSGEYKKSKSSAPRFRYLSSSSEDEQDAPTPTNTADDARSALTPERTQPSLATEVTPHADGFDFSAVESSTPGSPTTLHQPRNPIKITAEGDLALELVRRNGHGNMVTPTAPPRQLKPHPLKGDTVFITGGPYAGKKGTMMGQRGTDTEMFKIDIDTSHGEHMIVTASIGEISLSNIATAAQAETTLSPGAKVIKHRRRVEQPNPPQLDDIDASLAAPVTTAAEPPGPAESSKIEVDEDSIDEFFEKLQSDHEDADEPYFKRSDTDASAPPATQHPAPVSEMPESSTTAAQPYVDAMDECDEDKAEPFAATEQEHDAPRIPPELREAYENAMRASAATDVDKGVDEAIGSSEPSPCTTSPAAVTPENTSTVAEQLQQEEPTGSDTQCESTATGNQAEPVQESPTPLVSSTETLKSLASEDVGTAANQITGTEGVDEMPAAAIASDVLVFEQVEGRGNGAEPPQQEPSSPAASGAVPVIAEPTDVSTGTHVSEPEPPRTEATVTEQTPTALAYPVADSVRAPTSTPDGTGNVVKAEKKKKKKKHSTQKTTLQAGTQVRLMMGEFKGLIAEVMQEATGPGGMAALQGVYKLRVMNDRASITVLPDEFLQVIDPHAGPTDKPDALMDALPQQAGATVQALDVGVAVQPPAAEGSLAEQVARVTDEEVAEASIWN